MKLKKSHPLLLAGLVCVSALLPGAGAQQKRQVVVTLSPQEYLFFLDEFYTLHARVPEDDQLPATATQVQVRDFRVSLKATPTGTLNVPETRLECQGVIYVAPTHQIVVIGPRLKEAGFFVETAPDPNGSGNVEVLLGWNVEGKRPDQNIYLDYSRRPKEIEVLGSSSSSSSSDQRHEWTMRLVLRNHSDQPFTLPKEFFKNLPELNEWPVTIIPPAAAKK